ncbi:hypothetical protein BG003_008070 [Podila horticola]|nr:hypothetical protein BG003_008070 [Podila horticola]
MVGERGSHDLENCDFGHGAPVIKKVYLDVKPLGMNPDFNSDYHLSLQSGVPAILAVEQRLIWMRLRAMVSLERLEPTGYPTDFTVEEDMSLI